jgi:alpha-galactosidase
VGPDFDRIGFSRPAFSRSKGPVHTTGCHASDGWNSWDHFAGKVTDADVRSAADAMVASGMRDAGYVYINVDDTREGERDAQGNIQPNSRFSDMKALADYVHSKGLKFGIYSSPRPRTCAWLRGQLWP